MTNNAKPTAGQAEALSPGGKELLSIICDNRVTRAVSGPRKIRTVSRSFTAPTGYHFRPAGHVRLGSVIGHLNHDGEHDPTLDVKVVRIRQDKDDENVLVFTFPEVTATSPTGEKIKVEPKVTVKRHRDEQVLVKS